MLSQQEQVRCRRGGRDNFLAWDARWLWHCCS